MLDQWGAIEDPWKVRYGRWDPTSAENDPGAPSSPVDPRGNKSGTPGPGGWLPFGGSSAPAVATPAAVAPAAAGAAGAAAAPAVGAGLAATASKAIPWLELLYGIYKGQQKGKFQTPPTSPWQEKIFGKYYDWMTGDSPTNAALSPAIVEMMKASNPEFTLPNLIGPEAGKNVLPNGGHVGGANVDWTTLLQRLTAGGTPPPAPTNPVSMPPANGVLGKNYDWMTP